MASFLSQTTLMLFFLAIISSFMLSSEAGAGESGGGKLGAYPGSTAIIWGQNGQDGYSGELTLSQTCNQKIKWGDIVIISAVTNFGSGRKPKLSLASCDPDDLYYNCAGLSRDIKSCQRRGIKVFLSIGGVGVYDLKSYREAKKLDEYLWNNFLGGFSLARPLGPAVVDGINFDIEGDGKEGNWLDLAKMLNDRSTDSQKVLLSAAVSCSYPDPYLDSTVKDKMLDYIFVKFFNDPTCHYISYDPRSLQQAWDKWAKASGVKNKSLFLAFLSEGGPGWVDENDIEDKIIPKVQSYPQYAGVLIWNKKYESSYIQTYPEQKRQLGERP